MGQEAKLLYLILRLDGTSLAYYLEETLCDRPWRGSL